MTAEIILLDVNTKLDIPASRVLGSAISAGVDPVLVIGYDDDGKLYVAASTRDVGKLLLMMEQAKQVIIGHCQ